MTEAAYNILTTLACAAIISNCACLFNFNSRLVAIETALAVMSDDIARALKRTARLASEATE